jgi:hypothetical protein
MLKVACPNLPNMELRRRITILIHAMLQPPSNAGGMIEEWTDPDASAAIKDDIASLKDFLVGGLSAPVTQRRTRA